MIGRRTFLSRLGATAVALTLARHLSGIVPMPLAVSAPLQRGDVFTIAGQYAFNPQTRQTIPGVLQRFVAMEDVTGDVIPREHIWLAAGRVLGDVPMSEIAAADARYPLGSPWVQMEVEWMEDA